MKIQNKTSFYYTIIIEGYLPPLNFTVSIINSSPNKLTVDYGIRYAILPHKPQHYRCG